MRTLLASIFFLITLHLHAQQDYFYAEDLCNQGKYAEAVQVLDHLSANGAYADRPRFAMMTLNLAGSTKLLLKDTVGAMQAFTSAMGCYDSLTLPRKEDDWNRRERYIAGENLSRIYCAKNEYSRANDLLRLIRYPGRYYSSTGSDVLAAQDNYCRLRAHVFQNMNQPDSSFHYIRKMRDPENRPPRILDSIFDVATNTIQHIKFISFTVNNTETGDSSLEYLYFVQWNDKENLPHSIWFVNSNHRIRILGTSAFDAHFIQNFPSSCYDMSLSPDTKYLAVSNFTEGGNWIDVFLFPEIIAQQQCIVKRSIMPYPGTAKIVSWENAQLCIESDADLTKLNKKPLLSMPDLSGTINGKQLFLLDVESGKYTKK